MTASSCAPAALACAAGAACQAFSQMSRPTRRLCAPSPASNTQADGGPGTKWRRSSNTASSGRFCLSAVATMRPPRSTLAALWHSARPASRGPATGAGWPTTSVKSASAAVSCAMRATLAWQAATKPG